MSLVIELSPREEALLSVIADKNGLAPAEFVKRLIGEHLPHPTHRFSEDVQAKIARWQQEDRTQLYPDISTHALFSQWAEEDAHRTEQEREAEDQLWRAVEQGINETRTALGMRKL